MQGRRGDPSSSSPPAQAAGSDASTAAGTAGKPANAGRATETADLRFRSSFDQIAVGIAYTTTDSRILEVNRKLCEMLGYSAAELLGMKTRELTHPDDRDHQEYMRQELLEGRLSHFSGEKRYLRKDGSELWVSRTVALARDTPDGEPYLIQTIDDIDDRKRAEATLQRLDRARRVMAECNHIMIHATDETAMLNSICRIVVESGGYNQAWIGMPTGDDARPVRAVAYAGYGDDMPMRPPRNPAERNHYPWTTSGQYRGTAAMTIATGKMHIVRDIHNDPQLAHVRFRAQQLGYQCSIALPLPGDGKTLGVLVLHAVENNAFDDEEIGLLNDLSADIGFGITSLQARSAREAAERRFREIFEQAAVGITQVDLNGVLVNCNQKFSDMLGYAREELIGRNTRDITHPDDYGPGVEFRAQLGSGGKKSLAHEKRFIRKDGTPVWTRRTMSAACDAAGNPQYVIAVIEDISDRKQLEQYHRESFDQAAVGIVHTSLEGRYLRVNRKFCEMLGYDESELLGREAADFGRSKDREHDANTRRLMWAGKLGSFTEEKQFIRKDGATVWTNRSVSLARDPSGKPLYFIRIIEDITARKEADARYRATFDNAPIGILHTALDSYRILHVNPKMCEMLGYTEAELLQMSSTDIVHPDYRFKDGPKYRNPMLGGDSRAFSSERKFLRKDGSSFWVNRTVSLARDISGNPLYYIRIVEDITERKQAEELIARERALLRTIVDAIPDHIYVKDREGKYLLANREWLASLGVQLEDVVGKTAMDFYPQDQAEFIMAREREIMATGIPLLNYQHRKFRNKNSPEEDGTTWISLTKVPLQVSTGEIIGTVSISRDITGEKMRAARREMSHEVTRVLSEATTLAEALPKILQIMCQLMGWSYGARWAPDEARQSLRREEYWCATEPEFDAADREFWSRLDDVGPGRFLRQVWNNQTACWITDLYKEPFKRRASALKLGWHSAYAFPVLIGNNIISILEFFGPDIREPDTALLESTSAISSQIGQFIQRKQAEDKLTFLARFDAVTDLPNRYLFTDRLSQMLAQSQRNNWLSGVLFVDLDRFKAVNDTYGHAAGDELLRQAAMRMQACVRSSDTVGRLSGDEFAVMLSNLAKTEDAGMVAQKIVESLAAPFDLNGHQAYISASIGIALYPSDGDRPDTLLKNADTAMYRAKSQGRNGYQFYLPQMNERLHQRQQLEIQLRGALYRNEFLLHFQPKVSLATGAITGFEALLRWQHGGTLVSPSEFIGVLEDTGLIVPVGDWILNAVCAQIRQWEQQGLEPRPVAVNLSARQFQVKNLAEVVGRALHEHRIAPELLKLELTESLLMSDAEESVQTLHQLKILGVQLSVDDFGTGYSSLAYLKRFPLDELKIDREFIRDAVSDPDDAAITVTIINLAHSLKLTVVAEGVETEGQINFLRFHHCDEIQGFHFAHPLPADLCADMLAADKRLPQTQPAGADDSITLLLVVENVQELKLLTQAFATDNFRLLTAGNAADGFEILARNRVDIVISDNDMSGMSGVQFLTRVRKLYANTLRVLASSGDDTPTLTRATNMAGIHLFLPKTWSAERLRTEVRDTLRAYVDATTSSGPHPILKSPKD
jgi:diguanylate cyclase (GGDEF)-like protein/PAS domain S-box-containing protein